ncbi:MAG: DedA family protein [Tissierellia bacterium]|nr:DedA family protein [Tissierellia bacterium]
MNIQMVSDYFYRYGSIAIFVIVFLEYLNIPGLPSGIIMPSAGIWASKGSIGFGTVLLLSVAAGICGSWVLYCIGRWGGQLLLSKYIQKFPKHKAFLDQAIEKISTKGYIGLFLGKLLPMIRTIISIPAGAIKMNFLGYTIFSTLGILVWNLTLVGAGYLFGESVLQILG